MKQLPIRIPPLRDRPEDIEPYTYSLLASENWTGGIEPAAIALLTQQPWPGNVRALQSVLTTSVATTILRGGVAMRDGALLGDPFGAPVAFHEAYDRNPPETP